MEIQAIKAIDNSLEIKHFRVCVYTAERKAPESPEPYIPGLFCTVIITVMRGEREEARPEKTCTQ
ncbi:hypothetical protein D3C75_566670 [compost metagenome]